MVELTPGWQDRINEQAAESLRSLPPSARPMRERPAYNPPSGARATADPRPTPQRARQPRS
jgi:hypothetical protein